MSAMRWPLPLQLLLLCALCIVTRTRLAHAQSFSYALYAQDADSDWQLYDTSAEGSSASLAGLTPQWIGEVDLSEAGYARPTPALPSALAVPTSWLWPGSKVPFSDLPASQTNVVAARVGDDSSDVRSSDQLRRVSVSPPMWLWLPVTSRPRSAFLSAEWSCEIGSAGPALSFADRAAQCWAAGSAQAGNPTTLNLTSSLTRSRAEARSIYPLTLRATYASNAVASGSDAEDLLRTQALLMLLYRGVSYRTAGATVASTMASNTRRRDRSRVAVGFLWAFAALVMLSLCALSAAFQSWLKPLFPQKYAFLIWLLLLIGLVIGISVGTGISGFLMLLIIFLAYSIVVGIIYYIHLMKNRETPSTTADAEQKALLKKQAAGNNNNSLEMGSSVVPPAGVQSGGPLVVRPRQASGVEDQLRGAGGAGGGRGNGSSSIIPGSGIELAPVSSMLSGSSGSSHNNNNNAHESPAPLGDVDATDAAPPSLNAYDHYPARMGWMQKRLLGISAMCALLSLVLCVAIFGVWIVDKYTVLSSTDPRVLPLQPSVEERIPQTIAKSVQAIYAFDGLATRFKLDSTFFHVSTEWCGTHYSGRLESDEAKYDAIQKGYIEKYGIDMSEYDPSDYRNYSSVNDWFTRDVRMEFRPLAADPAAVVSPADARVTVWNNNPQGVKLWIKGDSFTMEEFLTERATPEQYVGGTLVLARLAPQDYHQFHMPLAGTLKRMYFLEGGLQSVNSDGMTSRNYGIYNQRTVMVFSSPDAAGGEEWAYVAIGALCVGSVTIEPPPGVPRTAALIGGVYAKGDKLGYFSFGGSTIALVFKPGTVRWDDALVYASQSKVETQLHVRSRIGVLVNDASNTGLAPT